jgi:ParB family chromosome partitioning protein
MLYTYSMADFYSNSIFWVEVDKIRPNPWQPRREFEEGPLRDLSESIRQYGVMQPLTVSRVEREKPEGGIAVEYELIAGERRLRASKLAGLSQVPVLIRQGDTSQEKLELAIIENLQRADLNPVERAQAFARLAAEFKLQHADIGKKMGRSREYVSNTLRILALPEEMLAALAGGKITEGHTRPLLMLSDRPEEQMVLFKEITSKKVTVREAERAARNIAVERARRAPRQTDPVLAEIEASLQKMLGQRVQVEQDAIGGRVTISFLTPEELRSIISHLQPSSALTETVQPKSVVDDVIPENTPYASEPAVVPELEPVMVMVTEEVSVPESVAPGFTPAPAPTPVSESISIPEAAPVPEPMFVATIATVLPEPLPIPPPAPVVTPTLMQDQDDSDLYSFSL